MQVENLGEIPRGRGRGLGTLWLGPKFLSNDLACEAFAMFLRCSPLLTCHQRIGAVRRGPRLIFHRVGRSLPLRCLGPRFPASCRASAASRPDSPDPKRVTAALVVPARRDHRAVKSRRATPCEQLRNRGGRAPARD